jgi:hypothetical protein
MNFFSNFKNFSTLLGQNYVKNNSCRLTKSALLFMISF